MNRLIKRLIRIGIALFFVGLAIVKSHPLWIEIYYTNGLYPYISAMNQWLWSWVPFSVGDMGYGIGIVLLIRNLLRFSFRRHFWKALTAIGLVVVLFYTSWGFLYFKTPLRVKRQLPETLSVVQLTQATVHYAQQTTLLHQNLSTSASQKVALNMDTKKLLDWATVTMEETPLRPKNIHGKAKATLYPTLLSYMGFAGYANPFTHEAQVNTLQPKLQIITTGCHEIAHQWGYAAEEEANYISIKATTTQSSNLVVAYAGNLLAFKYLVNALHRTNANQAKEIIATLPKGVLENINEARTFWQRYQNPFEQVFEKSYDQYLKANHQQAGIQSYSLVVGLLVDDFTSPKSQEHLHPEPK